MMDWMVGCCEYGTGRSNPNKAEDNMIGYEQTTTRKNDPSQQTQTTSLP